MSNPIDKNNDLRCSKLVDCAWSRRDFIKASVAGMCAVIAGCRCTVQCREAAVPAHHTNEHLQRVLNWSQTERDAAVESARALQQKLNTAIQAGQSYFRIPAGDYLEWIPDGHHTGHKAVLVVQGAENTEIDATGATFWNSGLRGQGAVIFDNCRNCTVKGLTADMIHSPFVQGVVTEIIPNGDGPGQDKLLLDLERRGFSPIERLSGAEGVGRTWLMRRDGQVKAYVSASQSKELSASGKWEWSCQTQARQEYGIAVGDRLSVGVFTGGGVSVIGCGGMTFEDLTVFSSGAFCVYEFGKRCPGGNTYHRMKIVPRPGSTRIGVGAMDGFHSQNQHQGPTLIGCEIARTHDDGINIFGFINVVIKKLPDNRYVLASIRWRDFNVGSELLLHRSPTMRPAGSAKVVSWEPFDPDEGSMLYSAIQNQYRDEYNTNLIDLLNPEFSLVALDRLVDLNLLDMATSHEYCGRGSLIDNLYMHDGCNRGILSPGTGAVVQNSRFENITFGGIGLCTGPNGFLQGGYLHDVKILNNLLENCGELVFGGWFRDGVLWQVLGAISVSPALPPHFETAFLHLTAEKVYQNIEIRGNRIRNTQGLPIFIGNTVGAVVCDNIIEKPFQASPEKLRCLDLTREGVIKPEYTPPVPEEKIAVLKEPFYGIFVIACEEVKVKGNRITEAPANFKGLIGIGPWCRDINVKNGRF